MQAVHGIYVALRHQRGFLFDRPGFAGKREIV
jgi:hypothetical protein